MPYFRGYGGFLFNWVWLCGWSRSLIFSMQFLWKTLVYNFILASYFFCFTWGFKEYAVRWVREVFQKFWFNI